MRQKFQLSFYSFHINSNGVFRVKPLKPVLFYSKKLSETRGKPRGKTLGSTAKRVRTSTWQIVVDKIHILPTLDEGDLTIIPAPPTIITAPGTKRDAPDDSDDVCNG
jgi:hypothetical protein